MAKNKTKKATLADRNREALAKAKANAKKSEETAKEAEVTTVETEKEETKEPEKKPTPEFKKTPYETYLEFKKHPHMGMISQTIAKNDKGIETITTEWKNFDTGETGLKQEFNASSVKKGDGIDLAKLREQAKLGMKEYMKKHAVKVEESPKEEKKEDSKPEPKKEEKKKAEFNYFDKEKKEKVIIPEEVKAEEIKSTVSKSNTRMTIAQGIAKLANHERIDENHQVELLGLIHKEYLANQSREIPEEQKAAMQEVFDGGMCQLTLLYAAQLEAEGRAILKGIDVTKEIFPLAKAQFAEMYGVDIKALPSKSDGQMTIKFTDIPKEIKKAAAADANALKKAEIPEPDPALPEKDKLDAIRIILSRSNASEGVTVPCRMATNVKDAIDWARQAFSITSEDPQVTLATMYQKFNDTKTLCLTRFMNQAWGSMTVNRNPFITHALIRKDFEGMYNDAQIAELVKVMATAHAEYNKTPENIDIINSILKGMDDKMIKKILNKEEMIPFAINGLTDDKRGNGGPGATVYSVLSSRYGFTGLGDESKRLKDKLNEIKKLYSGSIGRLAFYADESAYSKK